MNRLQKFVEHSVTGDKSKRAAYAFDREKLPPPEENLEWKAVPLFNAADEMMRDASLKDVFIFAIDKGCAIVEERTRPYNQSISRILFEVSGNEGVIKRARL